MPKYDEHLCNKMLQNPESPPDNYLTEKEILQIDNKQLEIEIAEAREIIKSMIDELVYLYQRNNIQEKEQLMLDDAKKIVGEL